MHLLQIQKTEYIRYNVLVICDLSNRRLYFDDNIIGIQSYLLNEDNYADVLVQVIQDAGISLEINEE